MTGMSELLWSLRVDGEPQQKERVRASRKTHRFYTPSATLDGEKRIRQAWLVKYPNMQALTGRVTVVCWFYMSKRGKPDVDNLVKLVLDALNGVAWADDAQVTAVQGIKLMPSVQVPGINKLLRKRKKHDPLTLEDGTPYDPHTQICVYETLDSELTADPFLNDTRKGE